MAQPDLILTPFGENANPGTINEIPESLGPDDPAQSASWESGFPQVTMTPLLAGGIPPRGQDVNGALRAISRHSAFLGGGGQYKWSSAYVAKNGGYSVGDVIQANDGLNSYVSLTDNNSTDFNSLPASIGTIWQLYSGSSLIQRQATEAVAGVARIATQPQADAGVDDTSMVTAKKIKAAIFKLIGFTPVQQGGGIGMEADKKIRIGYGGGKLLGQVDGSALGSFVFTADMNTAIAALLPKLAYSASDYIRIPDKPGGLIIQFGLLAALNNNADTTFSLPIRFPSAAKVALAMINNITFAISGASLLGATFPTLSTMTIRSSHNSTVPAFWIAIGN